MSGILFCGIFIEVIIHRTKFHYYFLCSCSEAWQTQSVIFDVLIYPGKLFNITADQNRMLRTSLAV